MEQPIFSFGMKEQLMVMLQNVNDVIILKQRLHGQAWRKHQDLIT